jgi:DNA-directed RNA polymerase alpha subunit
MKSAKIKVARRNGETIVSSDKGPEFKFGGKMLSETVIASLVFQTVYMNFKKLRDVSDNFEISLTMDYTVHKDEPQADNETLAKRIEDCNLSVRTTNICKANGIDTLGDLCKLYKTDWLKFHNSGKKSLTELDDLLHDHGLDWAGLR